VQHNLKGTLRTSPMPSDPVTMLSVDETSGKESAILLLPIEQRENIITTAAPSFRTEICIGVIDEYSFTRECISSRLKLLGEHFRVLSFESIEACEQATTNDFELVLLHVHGGGLRGQLPEETIASLKTALTSFPVIILSDLDSRDSMLAAFESGARGYIPTSSTSVAVAVEVIRLVRAGGTFVPPSTLQMMDNRASTPMSALDSSFTSRQRAVLHHLMQGKSNKVIAYELEMSESTVKVHIRNIMKKMQATNRTEVTFRVHNLWPGAPDQPVLSPQGPRQAGGRNGAISE
jgi:DNA-binding NarL/FixJ family response regulator